MKTIPTLTVTVDCINLVTLETMLERIAKASRTGSLDWDSCHITAVLEFNAGIEGQTFKHLEALIESQNVPHGVNCYFERGSRDLPSTPTSEVNA